MRHNFGNLSFAIVEKNCIRDGNRLQVTRSACISLSSCCKILSGKEWPPWAFYLYLAPPLPLLTHSPFYWRPIGTTQSIAKTSFSPLSFFCQDVTILQRLNFRSGSTGQRRSKKLQREFFKILSTGDSVVGLVLDPAGNTRLSRFQVMIQGCGAYLSSSIHAEIDL